MIQIGGHPTRGGFKDYVWVIVPGDKVDYISNDPCYEQVDRAHTYRESQWQWHFRNWTTIRAGGQNAQP